MEERILKEGRVLPGDILKVDSFLNHQLDVTFLAEAGKVFFEYFDERGVNKILIVSKRYLTDRDKVLIIDEMSPDGIVFR